MIAQEEGHSPPPSMPNFCMSALVYMNLFLTLTMWTLETAFNPKDRRVGMNWLPPPPTAFQCMGGFMWANLLFTKVDL